MIGSLTWVLPRDKRIVLLVVGLSCVGPGIGDCHTVVEVNYKNQPDNFSIGLKQIVRD